MMHRVTFLPSGRTITVRRGTLLLIASGRIAASATSWSSPLLAHTVLP